jgi:hypothetical protein
VLGYLVSPLWLLLPAVLGVLMLQSPFTGFSPVYLTPYKITPTD